MAAKRGRQPGFTMSPEHRIKIQNSNILNALIEHVTEGREMSATQVSAGLGLLRKVMPDLASTQLSGDPENPVHHKVEADEAFAKLTDALAGVAKAKAGSAGGQG